MADPISLRFIGLAFGVITAAVIFVAMIVIAKTDRDLGEGAQFVTMSAGPT